MSSNRRSEAIRVERGVVIGNLLDKAKPPGRIAQRMVAGFDAGLLRAATAASPATIHEVGCGEGRLARMLTARLKVPLLATDFSHTLIRENFQRNDPFVRYEQCSIHDLDPARHSADLVVCCEVLEHVENPDLAVKSLASLRGRRYILSVPREPIWRVLNLLRFRYVGALGNTPGHINHWSPGGFRRLLQANGFEFHEWINPFPWIMVAGCFKH